MPRAADFTKTVKGRLAAKVGYRCSNPFCRMTTIGANADSTGTINIGEAAHITAAEPGGPRFDPTLTADERKSESNGIWLCRTHAAMIDRDAKFFTVDLLRRWKSDAEKEANERIQGITPSENMVYTLRVLYDDLVACCEIVDFLIKVDQAVVIMPDRFHVPNDFEGKLERVVDFIGLNYASRMRSIFIEVESLKKILAEEVPRFKNRAGSIRDVRAVHYDHMQQEFLSKMDEYDIHEMVKTIGKLFVDESDRKGLK